VVPGSNLGWYAEGFRGFPQYLYAFDRITTPVPQLRRLVAGFPPRRPGFELRSDHMGFVVDEVTTGQVFSEYFDFPCKFSCHQMLHAHHLSSGVGTIGQLVVDIPSGLSLTPPQKLKKRYERFLLNPYKFISHPPIWRYIAPVLTAAPNSRPKIVKI
jgi:hypothetical protein